MKLFQIACEEEKTQLLDLMEMIENTENENETDNNEYTSPFADRNIQRSNTHKSSFERQHMYVLFK